MSLIDWFLRIPAKAIAWCVDKVLGWMGIESNFAGSVDNVFNYIKEIINIRNRLSFKTV